MIRCDNCGWYNLDSSDNCEKCGEVLKHTEEQEAVLQKPASRAKPMAQTEPKSFKKTVKFTPPSPQLIDNQLVKKETPATCPKCHYPLSGDVAFCPNCGTVIKRPDAPQDPVAKSSLKATVVIGNGGEALRKTGKETIRDFKDLVGPEPGALRLVPLHGTDHPEVLLQEGSVVTIGHLRFRVVK